MRKQSNPERNKALKVAQYANPQRGETKAHARLQSRIEDHSAMLRAGSKENKVDTRMETGGYHRPGSLKKIH